MGEDFKGLLDSSVDFESFFLFILVVAIRI